MVGEVITIEANVAVRKAVRLMNDREIGCLVVVQDGKPAGIVTEITLQQHGSIWIFTQTLSDGTPYPVLSPWIPFVVVYLGATVALIAASVRQIRQIEG